MAGKIMIQFYIEGVPVPQGRPKFFRRGSFVGVYDPPASKKAMEGKVKWQNGE